MRRLRTHYVALILAAVVLLNLVPVTGLALDGETVLTTVNHSAAVSSVNVTGATTVTLTVPYSYTGDVNLSSGLDISYNTSVYCSVVASFPEETGSVASVGGSAIPMTVSYQRLDDFEAGDPDPAPLYTTTYSVSVKRADYIAPTFSGTITKTANYPNNVTFAASDFADKYTRNNGGELNYITIEGSNPSFGTLQVSGVNYTFGDPIPYANLSALTFKPTGNGTVSYIINAYAENGGTIGYINSIPLNITVSYSAADITYSTVESTAVTFSASNFNSVCTAATGAVLSHVKFVLPSSSYGTLYYNYTSATSYGSAVSASTSYYYSGTTPELGKVTFVPYSGYTGTVTISYTGYNSSGDSFEGKVKITVTSGAITYTTEENTKVTFTAASFNTVCYNRTGANLSYVKFTLPSSSYGILYYNYTSASSYDSKVTAATKYYRSSSPYLSDVSFVPYSGYTGTVTISYTAYNINGVSYSGTVKITVTDNGADADTIVYQTEEDTKIRFSASDFDNVCEDATGKSLSYVRFTLPSSSYGKLYYKYTSSTSYDSKVASTTKYYKSSTPYLSYVDFVPYSGYNGTVTISYTGVNTGGDSYTGKVKITVGSASSIDTIQYETGKDEPVIFSATDFNNVCEDVTGGTLSYVKFTLPSTTYGILYYNYTSATSYSSKVAATTKYYRSTVPYLYKVSFVPKSGYTGTVTISYTGYNTGGESFTGKIKILVGTGAVTASSIRYQTEENTKLRFDTDDFNDACEGATGDTLSYVKFTLPSSSYGTLYYKYTSSSSYSSKVSAATKYYKSATPYLSYVDFVPYKDYSGTMTINYTGYNTDGDAFTGKVIITVNEAAYAGSAYFSDITQNFAWAVNSVDYLYKNGIVMGTGNGLFSPGRNITRGDFMLMLYRALDLEASVSGASNFTDVAKGTYYYNAILVAKVLGIAKGSGGKFYPQYFLTRQDAMVLVERALEVAGTTLPSGSSSDLAAFNDAGSVSNYAVEAVSALIKAKIIQGSGLNINPLANITRAEMAVILYRVLQM